MKISKSPLQILSLVLLSPLAAAQSSASGPSGQIKVVESQGVAQSPTVRLEVLNVSKLRVPLEIEFRDQLYTNRFRQFGFDYSTDVTESMDWLGRRNRGPMCVTPCVLEVPAGSYGVSASPRQELRFFGPTGAVENVRLGDDATQRLEISYDDDSGYRRTGFVMMLASLGLAAGGGIAGGTLDGAGYKIGEPLLFSSLGVGLLGLFVSTGLQLNVDNVTLRVVRTTAPKPEGH